MYGKPDTDPAEAMEASHFCVSPIPLDEAAPEPAVVPELTIVQTGKSPVLDTRGGGGGGVQGAGRDWIRKR